MYSSSLSFPIKGTWGMGLTVKTDFSSRHCPGVFYCVCPSVFPSTVASHVWQPDSILCECVCIALIIMWISCINCQGYCKQPANKPNVLADYAQQTQTDKQTQPHGHGFGPNKHLSGIQCSIVLVHCSVKMK
jgi:hypothetical protein